MKRKSKASSQADLSELSRCHMKLDVSGDDELLNAGKLLHPAAGSLHVEKFVNLEKLILKPPESAFWAVNGKAVESLQPLTRLKELVSIFLIAHQHVIAFVSNNCPFAVDLQKKPHGAML